MSSAQNQVPKSGRSPSSAPDSSSQDASHSAVPADPSVASTPPMISPPSPSAERILSDLNASSAPASAPAPAPAPEPAPEPELTPNPRQQPIPPASEPMQYRAIGLIQGKYEASPEQFTRGLIHADDGTTIDAVLLGRVMSLVRKHIDLEQNHLWVVYPRTREKSENLHMQVVGVWEPEKLASAEEPEAAPELDLENTHQDGYFSIRGEVLFYSAEDHRLVVKIEQSPRPGAEQGRMFKLNLNGELTGNKSVGYFWDLHVERKENNLVVREANVIGLVPPKKRKAGDRSSERSRRPMSGMRRSAGGSRPQRPDRPFSDRPAAVTPPVRREPISKPVKRPKDDSA